MHSEQNIKTVHEVGFVYKIIQGCRSTKHKNIKKERYELKRGNSEKVALMNQVSSDCKK